MEKKEYVCTICDKEFSKQSGLTLHVLAIHKNDKRHQCDVCNITFSRKQHLEKHVKNVHKLLKTEHCEACDKWFGKGLLYKHVSSVHNSVKKFKNLHTLPNSIGPGGVWRLLIVF